MSDLPTQASAVPISELTSALESQTAPKINGDAVQEDGAFVHAENKYEAEFQGDQPLQMAFKTWPEDGKHVVIKVIKGGIAEQQGVCVGHQLMAFGGKSFDGMSEQQVTREIKESTFTGKLELTRQKEDGGVDLPGAPAAAGDGKHKQRQEAAEQTLTEADKKLLNAAKEGKLQEAKDALNDGANVIAADKHGGTPLHGAIVMGHKEVADMLIEKGADMNAKDKNGRTPLQYAADEKLLKAAEEGKLQEVKDSLNDGARVDAVDEYGRTPLYWAAEKGHKEVVKMLIERGNKVDAADKNGMTPLHWAAQNGHKEIAGMLIAGGADVNAADEYGWTPLSPRPPLNQQVHIPQPPTAILSGPSGVPSPYHRSLRFILTP
jgi:ankyrin repeat protein